jgi:hypothetical protein
MLIAAVFCLSFDLVIAEPQRMANDRSLAWLCMQTSRYGNSQVVNMQQEMALKAWLPWGLHGD